MTILVTGATGNQGGAVVSELLERGVRVRALTRDITSDAAKQLEAAGAELVQADLDDRASLARAADRVDGVYSVQQTTVNGLTPETEIRWGRNVADAARAAGAHLVYSSVAGADRATESAIFRTKWAIEQCIREIGVKATVLRPTSFMENYASPGFGVQTGQLATALAPDTTEQFIALHDIGVFAALAFADPETYVGETISLAGDSLTPPEAAAALSRAAGQEIPYVQVPIETLRSQNKDFADALDFINTKGYGVDVESVRDRHPGLLTYDAWLSEGGAAKVKALFQISS